MNLLTQNSLYDLYRELKNNYNIKNNKEIVNIIHYRITVFCDIEISKEDCYYILGNKFPEDFI